jgi:predicted Rossmann fold nucleotide-binding protein DprA/Smf involved in DNA uptake
MTVLRIPLGDPDYPPALTKYLGGSAPEVVSSVGNSGILRTRLMALFCSVRCPGDLIIKTYDLARSLHDAGVPVIGGFHSPMEKECLALLLRGKQPVILCPARCVDGMRLRAE